MVAALLLAGLVAVPVGALVAIPAIRLSGLFLALATLGFGILIEQCSTRSYFMFGRCSPRASSATAALRPGSSTRQRQGYYFVVAGRSC